MTEARVAELEEALRDQLRDAWTRFDHSLDRAMVQPNPADERRGWSIEMLGVADEIAAMTRLVGPTSWEEVPVGLLLDGWWDAIYTRAGLAVPPFGRAAAEAVRARDRTPGPL